MIEIIDSILLIQEYVFFKIISKTTICFSFVALTHCEEFRQIINHKHLPSLKEFYFFICFPGHLYEAFQKTIVNIYDVTWPFNNLAYHLDEQLVSKYVYEKVTKRVLLFYTTPLDVLLQYTRAVFNHSFAQYSTQINRHSIEWICNKIDSLTQMTATFNKLASGRLDTLHLHFYETKVSIQMKLIIMFFALLICETISPLRYINDHLFVFQTFIQSNEFSSSWSHLRFPWLRCVIFAFAHGVIVQSERVYIIDQILHVSPRLSHLTVEWNDLRSCSQSNTNVKHLHLRLYKRYNDPNQYIDISHIFQLLPNICCLETSQGDVRFNENLTRFVVKIVDTFDQLVQLTLNKGGFLRFEPEINVTIEQAILNTGNKRLLNSNTCQIIFPCRNELRIWLS